MRLVCLWAVLFAINLFSHELSADQIFPPHAGGTFSRSSREPKYKIEFHPEDSPFHPDGDQKSVVMPNKNGERFLCFLPKEVEKSKSEKPVSQVNTSSLIVESEKRIKLKTPDELLDVLQDRCFIRVVQEFVLGDYDAESTAAYNQNLADVSTLKDPRSKDASQRYHAHQYTNGTMCDLTNQPRETEVRFVCSEPRAMISSITELSTCKYALTVQCPMLCKHPLFQDERPVWQTINCNALPKEYKEPKVEEDEKITMVTHFEHTSTFKSEEYAT
ncbi:ER lectin-like protein [Actinidia rufa]|uniref:ER lectin-like protein n=1 Tax=Actinidia rufa TaxID=165716 RepID=A0A7J0DIB1_9ERIC|nr:ER lectin-like protein [Actinidia rufa]